MKRGNKIQKQEAAWLKKKNNYLLLEKYIIYSSKGIFFFDKFETLLIVIVILLQSPKIGNAKSHLLQLLFEGEECENTQILDEATKKEISTRPTAYSRCERQIARGKPAFRVKAHIARRDRGEINKPGGGRETRFAWRRDHV